MISSIVRILTRMFMNLMIETNINPKKIKRKSHNPVKKLCVYNNKQYIATLRSLSNFPSYMSHSLFTILAIVILYCIYPSLNNIRSNSIIITPNNEFINIIINILISLIPIAVILTLYYILMHIYIRMIIKLKHNTYGGKLDNQLNILNKKHIIVAKADYISANIFVPLLVSAFGLLLSNIDTFFRYNEYIYFTIAVLLGLSVGHIVYISFIPFKYIINMNKQKSYLFYCLTPVDNSVCRAE